MTYAVHILRMIVPLIVLAWIAIILAWRHRTVATALTALGFGAVALSHIAGTLLSVFIFDDPANFTAAGQRFGWTFPVTNWSSVVGFWVGSLSLLWHTLSSKKSSNLRWGV